MKRKPASSHAHSSASTNPVLLLWAALGNLVVLASNRTENKPKEKQASCPTLTNLSLPYLFIQFIQLNCSGFQFERRVLLPPQPGLYFCLSFFFLFFSLRSGLLRANTLKKMFERFLKIKCVYVHIGMQVRAGDQGAEEVVRSPRPGVIADLRSLL